MLFHDLCTEYLEFKRCSVKVSTISTYKRTIISRINPILGDKECSEINEHEIVKYINSLSGLSDKSVSDIVVLLKGIIKYGNAMNVFNINLALIPCPRVWKKELTVLNSEEIQMIINYMSNHPSLKNLAIYISLYTGMRVGEICALRWEDIDFELRKIRIKKTIQRIYNDDGKTSVVILEAKTKQSIRDVPIPDHIMTILNDYRRNEGYVLTRDKSYMEPRTVQRYFKKIVDELGIDKTNFHILRHTFATRCIQCHVDVKSLSEILGHVNVDITLNRYVHSSFEVKRSQLKDLSF